MTRRWVDGCFWWGTEQEKRLRARVKTAVPAESIHERGATGELGLRGGRGSWVGDPGKAAVGAEVGGAKNIKRVDGAGFRGPGRGWCC